MLWKTFPRDTVSEYLEQNMLFWEWNIIKMHNRADYRCIIRWQYLFIEKDQPWRLREKESTISKYYWYNKTFAIVQSLSRVWLFVTLWTVAQPTRLHCPWDSPYKSTGMGCHALF